MNTSACFTGSSGQSIPGMHQREEGRRRARVVFNDTSPPLVPAMMTHHCSGCSTNDKTMQRSGADGQFASQSVSWGVGSETSKSTRVSATPFTPNGDSESNITVVIRVRPPLPRELKENGRYTDVVRVSKDRSSITLCEPVDLSDNSDDNKTSGCFAEVYATQTFTFDYVHDRYDLQRDVYERSARSAVLSVVEGYNATLLAYGQTGAGKTYTMEGFAGEEQHGIIARAVEEIFSIIDDSRCGNVDYTIRASYMQIYNEVISDLLKPPGEEAPRSLVVRHTMRSGVHVDGLSEWNVCSPRDVYYLMERGTSRRATEATRMSELSSRSHAIFILTVETVKKDPVTGSVSSHRVGKLNIVDLAGSEKVRQSGVSGQRLEEARCINKSLHELGNVISALAQRKSCGKDNKDGGASRSSHVPFRNSVLTSVLRDSLGGNCKTTLIVCISPALESHAETLSTLLFANRAKNIRNTAVINEDTQHERQRSLPGQQDAMQLQSQQGLDVGLLSELQQSVRRAEEEREEVVEALQRSLCAHQHEQAVRMQLQRRLEELEAILRDSRGNEAGNGGCEEHVDPEEYMLGLEEIHHQWQVLQEEAMLSRYNELLVKHRDIVVDLTSKLSERDEIIRNLKEELSTRESSEGLTESANDSVPPLVSPGEGVGKSSTALSREEAENCLRRLRVPKPRRDGSGTDMWYRSDTNPSVLLPPDEKILELLTFNHTKIQEVVAPQLDTESRREAAETYVTGGLKDQLAKVVQEAVERIAHQQVSSYFGKLSHAVKDKELQLLALRKDYSTLGRLMDASRAQQLPEALEAISYTRRYFDGQQETVRKAYEGSIEMLRRQLAEKEEKLLHLSGEIDVMRVESQKALEYCTSALQREELSEVCVALKLLQDHVAGEAKRSVERAVECAADACKGETHVGASSNPDTGFKGVELNPASSPEERFASATAVQSLEAQLLDLRSAHSKREEEWRRTLQERDNEISELLTRLNDAKGEDVRGKDAEISFLKRSVEMQKKDRRALQTIMEQRIKPKVDSICKSLEEGIHQQRGEECKRLRTEAQALQGLVSAAVKAMQS